MNASVDGDSLVVHHDVHLGIAVDLEFQGLIAPVIRDADGKRLRLIAREIRDLATRARTKQLGPDEILGGTFTITNMGPFGTYMTLPIINQPQVRDPRDGRDPQACRSSSRVPTVTTRSRSTPSACSPSRGTTVRSTARTPRRSSTRCARSSRPATGRRSSHEPGPVTAVVTAAAARGGSAGCDVPRGRGSAAGAARAQRPGPPAPARAPAHLHARHARRSRARARPAGRASAPSSCTRTAAATSPTTVPASWSATRSSRSTPWRDGAPRRRRVRAPARSRADRRARASSASTPTARTGSRASGSATRRSRRSA